MTSPSPYIFDVTQAEFEQKVLRASLKVPVLVDFWAPWCGPCKSLTPVLEKVVDSFGGRLLLAKVNTDDEMQLASMFGIRSLPTVMLIRDGRPVDGFMGAQPESAIRELLAAHLGDAPEEDADEFEEDLEEVPLDPALRVADLRAQVAAAPDKAELKLDLAQALVETGAVDEAQGLLDALPANLAESEGAKKLRSHLSFAHALAGAPARAALESAVSDNPADLRARHQLGTRLLLAGEAQAALDQFLEIMKRDRKFDEDLGRKTLIAAFDLVDDPDLVAATRRRMSALIF